MITWKLASGDWMVHRLQSFFRSFSPANFHRHVISDTNMCPSLDTEANRQFTRTGMQHVIILCGVQIALVAGVLLRTNATARIRSDLQIQQTILSS
jgi:hypothetical protein